MSLLAKNLILHLEQKDESWRRGPCVLGDDLTLCARVGDALQPPGPSVPHWVSIPFLTDPALPDVCVSNRVLYLATQGQRDFGKPLATGSHSCVLRGPVWLASETQRVSISGSLTLPGMWWYARGQFRLP